MRVVATAGHVDHGKSSLVLALTGTDPDRFTEEKSRGLTIDLGFAFTELASGETLAFVDVPGHVRFLKNMLAGVGAVEAAVFVVAANEGWMPQSEEHLRILGLLGVRHGLVVLTKADLVDDDLLELARLEVEERLATAPFEPAAVVAVDSRSGRGIETLRGALDAMLAGAPIAADRGRPRMWVDRVFSARGAGTVVTGTLAGGRFAIDDEVVLVPGRRRLRVRGLQSHGQALGEAAPGSRVAVNLAGVEHADVARGAALVRPGQWAPTRFVDVAVTWLDGVRPPRRGAYKAYIGSGEHDVSIHVLDDRFARLRLADPVALAPGDRLVIRSSGHQTTVGGAEVLDVSPRGRARSAPERLVRPLGERILAGRPWLAPGELVALAGVDDGGAELLAGDLVAAGVAARVGDLLVAVGTLADVRRRAAEVVAAYHRDRPLEPGLELTALAANLDLDATRVNLALTGVPGLVVERGRARLHTHQARVADEAEAKALLAALGASPFSPPSPAEVGAPPDIVRGLVREGLVVEVDGIHFTAAALILARARVEEALGTDGAVTVAGARDLLGSSRRYVLALLTWMDGEGITRRRGDERIAGPRAGA